MIRPTTSGVPPAAKGTITRTGLPGYCASAGGLAHDSASAPAKAARPSGCKPRRMAPPASELPSGRLHPRQQLECGLALDGPQIGGREAPIGDALVDLGAVAEEQA